MSPTELYWNMTSSAGSGVSENGLDGSCGGIMGNGLVVNTVGAYSGGMECHCLDQHVISPYYFNKFLGSR